MVNSQRHITGVIENREWFFFIGAIIVILLGSLLWYNHIHRPMEYPPKALFEKAFTDSPDSVTELDGGSNVHLGFEHWIKFKSSTPVHLRHEEEYKPYISEPGRAWFAERWKYEPALHDTAKSYQYLVRSQSGIGQITHDALLINKKQHYYFYRTWGM